jgi:uncharacterized protein YjbI with pentapeptide repeats
MTKGISTLGGRSLTITPLRAILALAIVAMAVSRATVAFGAIGDGGVIQICSDSGGNLKVVTALPCPRSYTALPPLYTTSGADAAFLTQAAANDAYLGKADKAADSDRLDGQDSSAFMPLTNCIGYPHTDIDWHGCDLHGANLSGARLDLADLSGANLEGADLTDAVVCCGANLSSANLVASRLQDANLVGANLANADLAHAFLRDADLQFASLAGANLTGANLTGANLTSANLTEATLFGANLTNASISGVTWANTICPDFTNSDANGGTCLGHL